MVFHAAHLAAQPNSSLKAPSMAATACKTLRCASHSVCSMPSAAEAIVAECRAAVGGAFRRRNRMGDFGAYRCLPFVSRPLRRVHASGLSCALRQARSSASATRPFGLRFPASPDPP
jgi:hypothetical protein